MIIPNQELDSTSAPRLSQTGKPLFRFFVKTIFWMMHRLYRITLEGLENLPPKGPAIFVANHQSYLDIPMIGIALQKKNLVDRNYWIIGKDTTRIPLFRSLFAVTPLIVVNGTVQKAVWALRNECTITIFPEGFYTWYRYKMIRQGQKPNLVRKIGNSAAILGLKTGYPIVPMGIHHAEKAWPPYQYFPRPGHLKLIVGKPFRFDPPEPEEVTDSIITQKAQYVMSCVDALAPVREDQS